MQHQYNGIFIGLGSNIGFRATALSEARKQLLLNGVAILQSSAVVETPAWGITDQPPFLNQVISVATDRTPHELLELLLGIEQKMGRIRADKWGPRRIDLDLLAYHQEQICDAQLTLPHPYLAQRDFVLSPWAEIAPRFFLPDSQQTVLQLHIALHSPALVEADATG
jgi:2-amino-4-hydroxy-6-hydroxymethyldihydropteridine diphosphokinase